MDACHYHEKKATSWVCEGCNKPYCTQCVPGGEANFRTGQPRCLLCSQRLAWRGDGLPRLPFWKRSREILGYPLKFPALWLLLAFGLANVMLSNFITVLFLLFVSTLLSVYAMLVIADVARDNWEPPSPMEGMSEGGLLFRQLGLMLALFVGPFLFAASSMVLALGLLALAAFILPAALMLLAVSGSLRMALNPLRWMQLILTVGASYLLLWLAVMGVTAAPALLESGNAMPALVFVGAFFSAYTTLVAAAMMGALLNEKGRQLGLTMDEERGRSLPEADYEVAEVLGAAHIYAQEGRLEDALKVVNRGLASSPMHQELNWRRLRLLKLLGKEAPWFEHLARFVRQQLGSGNAGTAVQIWLESCQQQSGLRFDDDPALCLSLSRALFERGRIREAQQLLVNLHQRAPQFKGLGEAYMLLARLYLEQGSTETATRLVGFVKKHFPSDHQSEEGLETSALLTRLQAEA